MKDSKIEFAIAICGILQILGFILTLFALKLLFKMPAEMPFLTKFHTLPFYLKGIMAIAGFAGFINFGFLIKDTDLDTIFIYAVSVASFIFMLLMIILG